MNIKKMTTKQAMNIKNNRKVVWDYYVSTMKAFNGHFILYLKDTGEIFQTYKAGRNALLKGDDIVLNTFVGVK